MSTHNQLENPVKLVLRSYSSAERAESMKRFFKTAPSEYGEGDQFWGISVPQQREVAKSHRNISLELLNQLIADPVHECRLTGVFILVDLFKKTKERSDKWKLCEFLLARTQYINNWDLVDSCAPQILGSYLKDEEDQRLLLQLSKSELMWEQRMAIVANQALIKEGQFEPILKIAPRMLNHSHDLIHKATGWMLREMGLKNQAILIGFLDQYASKMPRTMLRYSIEKFSSDQRKAYLAR